MTAVYDRQKLLSEKNIDKAFKFFDQNGDGEITADELSAVFGGGAISQINADIWAEICREVDTDGDGVISKEEFKQTMFDVLKRRASFL